MSTTTIVSSSATILQESGRMVLTILSSNTAAGVLAEKTQQALDAIDSAADTAMFTAGMYPDTATGLINTADGDYFSVPSGDMEEFAILYLNVSGTAVEQKRFPGAPILQATLDAAAAAADSEAAAADSETAAAGSASAAATSAGLADADRIAAEAARDATFAAAQASGVYMYDTKAAANAAVAGLPDLTIVEVLADESQSGARTRYRKESGSLVFKIAVEQFQQAGAGAVLRTAQGKMRESVSVMDFGATETGKLSSKYATVADAQAAYPGISSQITTLDQSLFWAALQSAINSLSITGGEVHINKGNWLLSDPVYGKNNVIVTGQGDASLITAEANARWAGKHLFYAQDCDNFFIKHLKIDQNGINRSTAQYTGAHLLINKSTNCGAMDVSFHDASDSISQSSTPQILIIAKDAADDVTDYVAMIGAVDGAKVIDCRFTMPDQNTRCGFAIRVLTDWLKLRARSSFSNFVKNCDISRNSFNGDFFWNHIELAGGGTVFNKITSNTFTGSGLSAIDFDKGCAFNVASLNIVNGWSFPANQAGNLSVRLAIFHDHGNSAYLNKNNMIINNSCLNISGRADEDNEALYAVQYVDGSLISGNTGSQLNGGTKGSGLLVDNYSYRVTASNNNIDGVNVGAKTSASLAFGRSISFIGNNLEASTSGYSFAAVAGSKIKGVMVSGGEAKSLSSSAICVSVGGSSAFYEFTLCGGLSVYGGGDCISIGADKNTVDNVHCYNAAGRSFRVFYGETSISNSTSDAPALGDLIVNAGVQMPTLIGNKFPASTYRNPVHTFASAIPSSGTYINSDTIFSNSVAASGFIGWICTTAGTLGTLAGVTANTSSGSPTIVVNSSSSLKIGDYLTIAGAGSANRRITAIAGTTVTLSGNVSATLTGAAVTYGPPAFKTFGQITA